MWEQYLCRWSPHEKQKALNKTKRTLELPYCLAAWLDINNQITLDVCIQWKKKPGTPVELDPAAHSQPGSGRVGVFSFSAGEIYTHHSCFPPRWEKGPLFSTTPPPTHTLPFPSWKQTPSAKSEKAWGCICLSPGVLQCPILIQSPLTVGEWGVEGGGIICHRSLFWLR